MNIISSVLFLPAGQHGLMNVTGRDRICSERQIDFRDETSLIFPQKTTACNLIRKFKLFQFDEQVQIPYNALEQLYKFVKHTSRRENWSSHD